ncbi:protein O-mannosyl-transferase TMTC2-like [Galendromus occidentalis]|uniref:dolichyl-phosphate-mannose--protein mannosyltransferase n=1 Tax=Galendromus occidentalis TaxID=34638 RepID=A0AAJ6QQV1_9ACAR|nr:protein O-mannosyl-transferase TMTC2-like [Galendromus occidentalis]
MAANTTLVVAVAILLAIAVYLNTVPADFAYDDNRAIVGNQDVRPTEPLLNLFRNDFWGTPISHSGSHKSYRPLCILSFRLNYLISGLDPRSYHLLNVLLHAVVAALFAWLAGTLFDWEEVPTFLASIMFSLHPVHTEAVAGVVGRADVGACAFFLLALVAYMKYCESRAGESIESKLHKKTYLRTTSCLALASMLTKEHGITVLAVCAVYDLFVTQRCSVMDIVSMLRNKPAKKRIQTEGLKSLACTTCALVLIRLYVMGFTKPSFSSSDNPIASDKSLLTRTLTFLYLPVVNLQLLCYPKWLSFDWSMNSIPLIRSIEDSRNLLTLFLYSVLYFIGSRICRALNNRADITCNINNNDEPCQCETNTRIDAGVLGMAMLILPYLPASNLIFYVGFVVAERVLYIPSMGYCILIAIGADYLLKNMPSVKYIWMTTLALLVVSYMARTVQRNEDWLTEESLYKSGIAVNPPKSYGNLGNVLSQAGRKSEAEQAYRKAVQHRPNMADVHYNLGLLMHEQGRYDEALESYQTAVRYRPTLALAHLNIGLILVILGRKQEAETVFKHTASIDGTGLKDPKLHEVTKTSALYNLGKLYTDAGKHHLALKVFEKAVTTMPRSYQPQSLYNMIGETYARMENFTAAEKWYLEALNVKPDHVPAILTYAKLLSKVNKSAQAESLFKRAIELRPGDVDSFRHYGQFLQDAKRPQDAAKIISKAARLMPYDFDTVFAAASALREAKRNEEAESFYRKAVRLRPREAAAHMNLGAMLHVNGKLHEAEQSYLEALRLKPSDAQTEANLAKLRQLLNKQTVR